MSPYYIKRTTSTETVYKLSFAKPKFFKREKKVQAKEIGKLDIFTCFVLDI